MMIRFFKTDKITRRCFELNMAKGWGYFKLEEEPDAVDKGWGFLFYYFGFVITTPLEKGRSE